ncbi:MAG TPA: hypothetical protein VF937_11215 [Chloroflexota bacterium]
MALAAVIPGVPVSTAANGSVGNLDCNGFSAVQAPLKQTLVCADITGRNLSGEGFEDNGHYVGHDEASTLFYSTVPGSGSSAQYDVILPREPSGLPNGTVTGPVWDFQTLPVPWFGMVMCDNQSFPEGAPTCVPDSDTNIQVPPHADHAGTAYMELQLYAPGYSPFISRISCDQVHWCAALNIDSFQSNFDLSNVNPNCTEPVNFAFLTRSGVPVGPPGPDTATAATFTPTPDVLLMNQGDHLRVTTFDSPAGFVSQIEDLTTGASGSMVASEANGFRHIRWDPVNHTCQGEQYAFHPMYDTAAPPTASGQPTAWAVWTAHTWNVAYTGELGHFETPDLGGTSGEGKVSEEGPCFSGPTIPGCLGFFNLDIDFDGYTYRPVWPDGTAAHASPLLVSPPTSRRGTSTVFGWPYATIQFETDILAIQSLAARTACSIATGAGCSVPPAGAAFYPWMHTLQTPGGGCAFALTNDGVPGAINNFGGPAAGWGPPELTDYGAGFKAYLNFASGAKANPCR